MMSYDKYERGRQHLNGGHQRITYKDNNNNNNNNNNTLLLTQSNQLVGVDHAVRIDLLNSPPMTGKVEKKKMIVMMTMMYKR